jgi:hypothetical protein
VKKRKALLGIKLGLFSQLSVPIPNELSPLIVGNKLWRRYNFFEPSDCASEKVHCMVGKLFLYIFKFSIHPCFVCIRCYCIGNWERIYQQNITF